ncbi:MAG: two-component regulator propeller domain-containing protein [Phycisphaerales bacterium JB065]
MLAASERAEAYQALVDQTMNEDGRQVSAYIREVFQDRSGVYWFGTNGEGVARYDENGLSYFSIDEGFGGIAVRGIVQDASGAIWFATDGGVSRYKDGSFTNYTDEHGLLDTDGWNIFLDSSDTIWASTMGGVVRFDGERFVPFAVPRAEVENPEPRFTPTLVWSMLEDTEGNLWFGTDGEGVRKYDGKTFTTYTTEDGLAGNNVRSIYQDRRGDIWFGATAGLTRYDGTEFRAFTEDDGVPEGWVWTFGEDQGGDLWISVLRFGLVRYDGESFTAYSATTGRSRTHVQSIYLDQAGTFWFGCSGGLYQRAGDSFINITTEGPWPVMSRVADEPMAAFERMVHGEWRLGSRSGWSQFDRWQWGPGKRSIVHQTYGTDNEGDPWRVLSVYYHDSQRDQISMFSMHRDIPGIGRGLSEGTLSFDADIAEGVFDIRQSSRPRVEGGEGNGAFRKMALKWSFTGNEHYIDTLLENSGRGFATLAEWKRVRTDELTPMPAVAEADAKPSGAFAAFGPLAGRNWVSSVESPNGGAVRVRTDVEWIPYVQVIRVRSESASDGVESAAVLEAFIYRHPVAGTLHTLALASDGTVYKGSLNIEESGDMRFDLRSTHGEQLRATVSMEADGMRMRVWSVEDQERTLLWDAVHQRD